MPPSALRRRGHARGGAIAPGQSTLAAPDQSPAAGDRVDYCRWAYGYRKGAASNASETDWLWPKKHLTMKIVNGSMVWDFVDTPDLLPKPTVLCGCLWEEPREINRVEVEFPDDGPAVPKPDEVEVYCRPVQSMWADCKPWKTDAKPVQFKRDGEPVRTSRHTAVFGFVAPVDHLTLTKLYVVCNRADRNAAVPTVRAYGASRWAKPLDVNVEWESNGGQPPQTPEGRVEAYNGLIGTVEPLEAGGGLEMLGPCRWRERSDCAGKRGIKLQVFHTVGPVNGGTIVSLRCSAGNLSFAVRDLEQGPILVPSLGVFICRSDSKLSAKQFREQLAAKGGKTTRQRIREHSEQDIAAALKAIRGIDSLPKFPVPPYETPMKIDVPEPVLNQQWRLGAWHLRRWSERLPDGTYCVSIWPPTKGGPAGDDGNEGAAAIGAETYQIIRTLDLIGCHDVAEGGLNYWLFGKHAKPFIWFAETMGDGALVVPFNGPNHHSPGYDQKHSGGHGIVLDTAVFHYRLTADRVWLDKAAPRMAEACRAIGRVRRQWMKTLDKDVWCYGLLPPANTGDDGAFQLTYYLNANWYAGLMSAARLLTAEFPGRNDDILREAEAFRTDFRAAVDRSLALTSVVKVADGTYRRYVSWRPYQRGIGTALDMGTDGWGGETCANGMRLIPNLIAADEPAAQEMLDVHEDILMSRPQQKEFTPQQWFSQTGFGPQAGHEFHFSALLLSDDVAGYIRALFNDYAAEIDPALGYTFWEGPFKAGAADKTFEEAAFLERMRNMLILEQGETLWLAKATPRAWLEQGKKIAVGDAPTLFGTAAYEIVSDVDHGKISATVGIPDRNPPGVVLLRFRHPQALPMKSVRVNGTPWTDFDPAKEVIRLQGLTKTVRIEAAY